MGDALSLRVVGPSLTLRFPTLADAPALFALASDAEVTRFFSWGPYEHVEEAERYISSLAGRRERGQQMDFAVEHAGHGVIGVTGLSELSVRDRRATVGSWLGREHWGSGANTEAKALIARLAFERLGMDRLTAWANVTNPRSQAALEKVGFEREGVLRAWHRHGDVLHDVCVYSLLRSGWPAPALAEYPATISGEPPPGFVLA